MLAASCTWPMKPGSAVVVGKPMEYIGPNLRTAEEDGKQDSTPAAPMPVKADHRRDKPRS